MNMDVRQAWLCAPFRALSGWRWEDQAFNLGYRRSYFIKTESKSRKTGREREKEGNKEKWMLSRKLSILYRALYGCII